jgi:hypothetical protein
MELSCCTIVGTGWKICRGKSEAGIFASASNFTIDVMLALLLTDQRSLGFAQVAGSCENYTESSCSVKGARYLQVINHH